MVGRMAGPHHRGVWWNYPDTCFYRVRWASNLTKPHMNCIRSNHMGTTHIELDGHHGCLRSVRDTYYGTNWTLVPIGHYWDLKFWDKFWEAYYSIICILSPNKRDDHPGWTHHLRNHAMQLPGQKTPSTEIGNPEAEPHAKDVRSDYPGTEFHPAWWPMRIIEAKTKPMQSNNQVTGFIWMYWTFRMAGKNLSSVRSSIVSGTPHTQLIRSNQLEKRSRQKWSGNPDFGLNLVSVGSNHFCTISFPVWLTFQLAGHYSSGVWSSNTKPPPQKNLWTRRMFQPLCIRVLTNYLDTDFHQTWWGTRWPDHTWKKYDPIIRTSGAIPLDGR